MQEQIILQQQSCLLEFSGSNSLFVLNSKSCNSKCLEYFHFRKDGLLAQLTALVWLSFFFCFTIFKICSNSISWEIHSSCYHFEYKNFQRPHCCLWNTNYTLVNNLQWFICKGTASDLLNSLWASAWFAFFFPLKCVWCCVASNVPYST